MLQKGLFYLFQVSFPCYLINKQVYYTIYHANGDLYQARTHNGVVEYGGGQYGVLLAFSNADRYSILWDIDNLNIKAGEEINVEDSLVIGFTNYTGYGL